MKNILLPTDFSDASINAVNYGLEMAIELSAKITLIHIYQIPIYYGDVPILASDDEKIETLKNNLIELKKKLISKANTAIEIVIEFSKGDFLVELMEHCIAIKPYCVIIGCQGKSAFENTFFGSNSVSAMKHLLHPIIAVPIDATFSCIKNIGLACDFENEIEAKNIEVIKNLAIDFKAELHVCNIGKKEEYNVNTIYGMKHLSKQLNGLNIKKHIIEEENIEKGLIAFEKECTLDLLIIFPKHYNFFEKLFHISETKKMVLQSTIPIMALHQ